jgi:hypothetical protein
MAPVQRDGLEYEFDVVADLDQDNNLIIGKTRCPAIAGMVVNKAGREVATKLSAWLSDGGAPAEEAAPAKSEKPAPKASSTRSRIAHAVEPAAEAPVVESVAPVEDDFASDLAESMHCHCGVEARYVRGKSGNGWVCGNFGEPEACNFRMKDTTPEPAFDPFEDAEPAAAGTELNGKGH